MESETVTKKIGGANDSELKQEETLTPAPPLEKLTISSDKENEDESDSELEDMFIGLSAEQIAKMRVTITRMQNGYNDHCAVLKQRRIEEVQEQIQFNLAITVNDEEADFISSFVEEHNEDLLDKLENEGLIFLESMKEMMEQKRLFGGDNSNNYNDYDDENEYDDYDDDEDEDWILNEKKKKAQRAAKRKNNNLGKNRNLDGSQRCGRLLLNDALKNVGSMDGWSDARKKAWNNRQSSPNAYFYRFNVPGQPQKNGKWTREEQKLFMRRCLEFGVNDQWGIFSKKIPGRVGYQCSNYWRGLVKDGDVTDPNYHYDGKKLHFKRHTKNFSISNDYRRFAITINRDSSGVWTNLPKKHPRHPSVSYCKSVQNALSEANGDNVIKSKKRKRNNNNNNNDDDEDWNSGKKTTKRRRKNKNKYTDDDETYFCKVSSPQKPENDDNPMIDFIDIMTGTKVIKPTISPYGHVLGYDTWTKILRSSKHKNLCPFTLQKMTRRGLIKLTKDNYDEYKDKITNITKEQTELMNAMNN